MLMKMFLLEFVTGCVKGLVTLDNIHVTVFLCFR